MATEKLLHTCDVYGTGYAKDAFIDKIDDTVYVFTIQQELQML